MLPKYSLSDNNTYTKSFNKANYAGFDNLILFCFKYYFTLRLK